MDIIALYVGYTVIVVTLLYILYCVCDTICEKLGIKNIIYTDDYVYRLRLRDNENDARLDSVYWYPEQPFTYYIERCSRNNKDSKYEYVSKYYGTEEAAMREMKKIIKSNKN